MSRILTSLGINKEVLPLYCGIGDLCLTSRDDLTRNRTLSVLIGKGFFNNNIAAGVTLEGKRALGIFHRKLTEELDVEKDRIEMLISLQDFFSEKISLPEFVEMIVDERWPFGSPFRLNSRD